MNKENNEKYNQIISNINVSDNFSNITIFENEFPDTLFNKEL